MKWFRRVFWMLLLVGFVGIFSIYLINRHIHSVGEEKMETSITEIPKEETPRVAIVFGAKVWANGEPSNALYDRVITAVELYRAGRVRKLLMSGDHRAPEYDEPAAMKKTAIALGVPERDIVLDAAGRRTFDTCYRAKEIYEVKRAILVTQEFHLPRSLYLCSNLGIDSVGITADRRQYEDIGSWKFREFFSAASAWFEINFMKFEPVGGEKEPIAE